MAHMVRFDVPCVSTSRAMNYFSQHMGVGDYLSEGGRSLMTWHGVGATRLGMEGKVQPEHFKNLCEGKHPVTGERLGARDKGPQRRVCFFGQISAPKDVSIALLVGGDQRITSWWNEAVKDTLQEIEPTTKTRVRRGGLDEDRDTGNMISAVVTHDASRSLDPQLHTHVCIMNLTHDPVEGRWKGLQPSGYFVNQGFFREVCYNKLAQRMVENGYEIENVRKIGFTIKGFPDEVRERFSKRRKDIQEIAEKLGVTSQDDLQKITGESRAKKIEVASDELKLRWKIECGVDLETINGVISNANGTPKAAEIITEVQPMKLAMDHVFERKSVVDERVLLREALIFGRAQVDLEKLRKELALKIESKDLIYERGKIASRIGLEMEHAFTEWAFFQKNKFGRLGDSSQLDSSLGEDQKRAAMEILDSRDRVVILKGDAGTGKTTTLKEILKGIEKSRGAIFACAPSSGAADVLRKELTSDADTLQQLLVNPELQRNMRGRTIIVDEAGLISVQQMHDLCVLAKKNHHRLILVGDTKQHTSVEAGDSLRAMEKFGRVEVIRLTQIRRQKNVAYRKAVSLLAEGKALDAFKEFETLGAVKEFKSSEALFKESAKQYVRTIQQGRTCLAISPVWTEIHEFTEQVRQQLKFSGILNSEDKKLTALSSFQWTEAEKKHIKNYKVGDVLTFHQKAGNFSKHESVVVANLSGTELIIQNGEGKQSSLDPKIVRGFDVGLAREISVTRGEKLLMRGNLKEQKIQNGDIVEVIGFGEDGSILLKDGRKLPSNFRQFTYGYASTSHAAQGKTVDCGILIMGDQGIKSANLKQAYVSNSRFKETQIIFTTDKIAARNAMATDSDRLLAMELKEKRVKDWKWLEKIINGVREWTQLVKRKMTTIQNTSLRHGEVHVH